MDEPAGGGAVPAGAAVADGEEAGGGAAVVAVILGLGLRWCLAWGDLLPRADLAPGDTGAGDALTARGCAAALPAISPARPGSRMTRTRAPATREQGHEHADGE
ncbi:MAG TPA: hypothetical protein VF933_09925 [Streptosporangiaceae bacterium]